MSTAVDTPDQRHDAYGRLFADALVRRERRDGTVVLAFRADPRVRATVDDLVHREATCCPFLDHRVETIAAEIVWTITNPVDGEDRASVDVLLDAIHELPDQAGVSIEGFLERLAARGLEVIEAQGASLGWDPHRQTC